MLRRSMFATILAAALALGFGMSQPPAAPAPSITPAEELQGGTCGDYRCQPPEDCRSCPQDCGDCCGNHRCEPPEDCRSCPQDCPC